MIYLFVTSSVRKIPMMHLKLLITSWVEVGSSMKLMNTTLK
jgi:hypothetical protein